MNNSLYSFVVGSLLLAACGGDDSKQVPDAAAGKDACVSNCGGTPDAMPLAPVKVIAVLGGRLSVGTTVIFQRADDSVISTKITDASGEATELMPDGGSVTVVDTLIRNRGGSNGELFSFVGVKPGDVLVTGSIRLSGPTTQRSIKLPLTGQGNMLSVSSICGSGSILSTGVAATLLLDLFDSCTTVNMFVNVTGPNRNDVGQFYKSNIVIPANGIIDLSAEIIKPAKQVNVALSNIPTGISGGTLALPGFDGSLQMGQPGSTFAFQGGPSQSGTTLIGDSAAPESLAQLQFQRTGDQFGVIERTLPGDYSLDVGSMLVPALVTQPQKIDLSTFAWTETNQGQADASVASILVRRANPPFLFTHAVVAPHQVGSIRLPVLPTAFDKFNIQVEDTAGVQQLILSRSSLGYDRLRQNFFRAFDSNDIDSLLPAGAKLSLAFNAN
jgi:hypothetical protein